MSQVESRRRSRRDTEPRPPTGQGPALRLVQVQAARLRLVTDRRLGKTSPQWVHQLAAEGDDTSPYDT